MGYKAELDYDNDRLPPGMTRVGYDERTQIYTYRDSDGSYWQGPPGSRYGTLYCVSKAPEEDDDDDDEEADETPASSPAAARPHNHHPILRHHRLSGTTIASDNDNDADIFSYSYSFPDADYDEKHPTPSPPPPTPLKRSGTLSRLTRFRMSPLSVLSISLPRWNLDPFTAPTIHPSPLLSHPAFYTKKELDKTNKLTHTTKVSVSTPPSASRSQRHHQQRPNQPLSRRATVTAAEGVTGGRDGYGRDARRQSYRGWHAETQTGTGTGNTIGNGSGNGTVGGAPVVRRKRATTFDEILAGF